ncbi:hypothetical protein Tco_0911382 [Tanacetum coccineum]|uniref:Integrase, catalytic region, zinc finger, CCHC-type, peptidase aspartic, catalytic n=1 Tax=Tanacetum coccineum TaxID=301880 RepID=A0ABQ5CX29_9ASTR
MDLIIPLRQKNTLAEYMIVSDADNRPPMLDKDLYDSWKIIWPTVEENGVTRTKKYAELFTAEKIQADCDMQATNIILQGLPADIYSLMNHHRVAKDLWERVQLLMQVVASSQFPSTNNQIRTSLNPRNQANIQDDRVTVQKVQGRQGQSYSGTGYKSNATSSGGNNASEQVRVVKCYNYQGERHMARQCTQPKRPRNASWYKEKAMLAEAQEARQILDEEQLAFLTEDLDTYDSDCNDILNAKAVLMANISNYGSDVISKGQSAETVHMLTKPQAFYDNIHKQAIGYQNPFYLKKAQRIKPTLLSKDFRKRFTPQQELSTEQAFWLHMYNPTSKPSDASPIKIEAPKELPKVSLVNKSLKKLKFHLARFDNVVKIGTTPDARTEDLLNEIMDVQTVLDQMDAVVQQSSVDKQYLEPLAPRLLQNREAYIDYLKYTQEQADILWEIVKQAKAKQPLDKELDFAYKHAQRIQELLVYAQDTCPNAIKLNEKKVVVTPKNKVKKVRFAEPLTSSSNIKQHSLLKANSELICATCHVFTEVGLKWKLTGRTFTIVGNSCPLTRITSANIVPPKKTTSHLVETQKPKLKVYSRKPKNVKNIGSSKKAKIVESKNANYLKPNHTWGSNAIDIPSSSPLVMTCCPDCSLVSGLWMFETHDKEPLLAHELC